MMKTVVKPNLKQKTTSFSKSYTHLVEKEINQFDFKFYQKLFLILLASCTFLIFPESPKNSEVLCKKYHSIDACIVW